METPPATMAISRREQHYACGCTTTRVERILLLQPDRRQCPGHAGDLIQIIHTIEFEPQPAQETWQLHSTD